MAKKHLGHAQQYAHGDVESLQTLYKLKTERAIRNKEFDKAIEYATEALSKDRFSRKTSLFKGPPGSTEISPTLANEIKEFCYRSFSKSTRQIAVADWPD